MSDSLAIWLLSGVCYAVLLTALIAFFCLAVLPQILPQKVESGE
jgi:hypothetical protein